MTERTSKKSQQRRTLLKSIATVSAVGPFSGRTTAQQDQERTIDYAVLSPMGRRIFVRSLKNGRSDEFPYVRFPDQLLEHDFVRHREDVYDLRRRYRNEATYKIAPEKIHRSKLTNGDEQDVIEADQLSSDANDAFLTALSEGVYQSTGEFPIQFKFRYQYVSYSGELFDLQFSHGDVPLFTIAPKMIDGKR